jgi:flagellar protein FliO/FliZ
MGLDSLLGVELSLPVKAIVAFVVVLVLLGIVTWLFRRIGGERPGAPAGRGGRQPRLAVIDAAAVDNRRRLVLIRRDNVEHLIMIGGPTDVVVEQNIVRAVPVGPGREPPGTRGPAEPLARAPAEPLSRAPTDAMRPMASPEIAPRVPTPRPEQADRGPRSFEPRRPTREAPREFVRPQRTQPTTSRGELEPPPVEVHAAPPTADANLADMAQRLEAALRRPGVAREPLAARETTPSEPPVRTQATDQAAPAAPTRPTPPPSPLPTAATPASVGAPAQVKPANAPAAAGTPASDSKPDQSDAKPDAQGKSVLDSLEEEMASLLGRPEKKDG